MRRKLENQKPEDDFHREENVAEMVMMFGDSQNLRYHAHMFCTSDQVLSSAEVFSAPTDSVDFQDAERNMEVCEEAVLDQENHCLT